MIDPDVAGQLMALVDQCPESKQEIERLLDFPAAWLSQAKRGMGSAKKWGQLREFLSVRFGAERVNAIAPRHLTPDSQLAELVQNVETQEQRQEAEQAVAVAVLKGDLDRARGELVLVALRQLGATMEKTAQERGALKIAALEILTEDEIEALANYRASKAGNTLKPGESAVIGGSK